jgi:hypothetical protein
LKKTAFYYFNLEFEQKQQNVERNGSFQKKKKEENHSMDKYLILY